MFLYQETYYVTPGLQDVIDARVRSLHENHSQSPQFAAADWMKYTGDSTTYLAFRLWSDRDVTYSQSQAEWMREYNRTRPADAFMRPPDIEYFEQVKESGSAAKAAFLVCCRLEFGTDSPAADLEKDLEGQLLDAPGFAEYRVYRFMGGENRLFRAEFWRSQEAALEFWRAPDRREYMAKLAALSNRGAPRFDHYEVLHQLGSARPA
ncbi:MAG TPA: antibiotic biosynthesis monooxygenase [Dehalococcoidia bacterium]|nr:antibiotic biosynthesis monooxygenase [Dehalococcoidia bacterium]